MSLPKDLDELFQTFVDRIIDGNKKGTIKKEFFTKIPRRGKVHDLIVNELGNASRKLGYQVEKEKVIPYKTEYQFKNDKIKKGYRADILLKNEEKNIAIIEYESTNSSDRRIYNYERVTCPLRNYNCTNKMNLKYYIVIISLPKEKSVDKNYKIRSSNELNPDEMLKAKKDPYKFFMNEYELKNFQSQFNRPSISYL